MMKKMLVLICMASMLCLLVLTACNNRDDNDQSARLQSVQTELKQLKAAFKKTESERDELKVNVAVKEENRNQLQQKLEELAAIRKQLQIQIEKFTFTCDQSRQQLEEIIDTRDKLKAQVAELTDSRDKLLQRLTTLTASHNQLSKQVKRLTVLRDEAVLKAQTAQKRIDTLVAMLEAEKSESPEWLDRLTAANPAQRNTQPAKVQASGISAAHAAVPAEVSRAAVIPDRIDGRPTCHSFNTTRPWIIPGQTSTLSWQVSNADSVRIEPGIGLVSALGSREVVPSATTMYSLIASNQAGQSSRKCKVEVGKVLGVSSDRIRSRKAFEQEPASGDAKVLTGQKTSISEANSTLGKFLGYRARRDESGKFIFIPVFENLENQQEE